MGSMAPYVGPSLAALIPLLQQRRLDVAPLGSGLPRALVEHRDGAFELHAMAGGEGFGVQADRVTPFVDAGVLVRAVTWQELVAWLCEHWDTGRYGDALSAGEQLRLTFSGDSKAIGIALRRELQLGLADCIGHAKDGLVAATIDVAARACRAARSANAAVDFAVIRGNAGGAPSPSGFG
jgi:hypothetical protein